MGTVFRLKHGNQRPPEGSLEPFELGVSRSNKLYIGKENNKIALLNPTYNLNCNISYGESDFSDSSLESNTPTEWFLKVPAILTKKYLWIKTVFSFKKEDEEDSPQTYYQIFPTTIFNASSSSDIINVSSNENIQSRADGTIELNQNGSIKKIPVINLNRLVKEISVTGAIEGTQSIDSSYNQIAGEKRNLVNDVFTYNELIYNAKNSSGQEQTQFYNQANELSVNILVTYHLQENSDYTVNENGTFNFNLNKFQNELNQLENQIEGKINVNTKQKSGFVYAKEENKDITAAPSFPYYRVAKCLIPTTGENSDITNFNNIHLMVTILVEKISTKTYVSPEYGILQITMMTNSQARITNAEAQWIYASEGIHTNDFKITYNEETPNTQPELWCYISRNYSGYLFTVLNEFTGNTYNYNNWWTFFKDNSGWIQKKDLTDFNTQILKNSIDKRMRSNVLYSPIINYTSQPAEAYSFPATYSGATILINLNSNKDAVFNLTYDNLKDIPAGAEITFIWYSGNSVSFIVGDQIKIVSLNDSFNDNITDFQISYKYGIISLKKLVKGTTDVWIAGGNVMIGGRNNK